MENQKKQIKTEISVPMDVLLDIAHIIITAGLKNEISGIKHKRGLIEISLYCAEGEKHHKQALEDIGVILKDYDHLRFSEEEENHWREI